MLARLDPNAWSTLTDWGSRLAWWQDATVASSITIATGVSQWSDLGPYARHATQGTGAAQPTNGGNVNGRNAITFSPTGTIDQLNGTVTALATDTLAIFWVGRMRTGSGTTCRLVSPYNNASGTDEGSATGCTIQRQSANQVWQAQRNSVIPGQVAITYDVPFIACVVFDGATCAQLNGWIPAFSAASTGTFTGDRLWYGYNLDGEIGECIGITGPFTAPEIYRQYRALSQKWGIV